MATEGSGVTTLDPLTALTRDLRKAAQLPETEGGLTTSEVRFLVDYYYTLQDARIRSDAQVRAAGESKEPHATIIWLAENARKLEGNIKSVLDKYADSTMVGQWSKSIVGIGPVIAAGLLAHIDITKAPTVGHIWRFAGLDPTSVWLKGQKRPWNARLKVLCWKMGESFKKVKGNERDIYGGFYDKRKTLEWEQNLAGMFKDQATKKLVDFRIGKNTGAYLFYSGAVSPTWVKEVLGLPSEERSKRLQAVKATSLGDEVPMLPPAHIDRRAARYATKMFLSHWWFVAYVDHYATEPPLPYPVAILGHAPGEIIPVPNWPFIPKGLKTQR